MTQKFTKQERALLAEIERRTASMQVTARTPVARQSLGFDRNISEHQQLFIDDPCRRVLVCTGRRGGKSFAIIVKCLQIVLGKEDSLCWFIAPSRERAKLILWTPLKRINAQYKLGAKFNDSDLTATFPTGAVIRLIGIEDVYHSDRLRGHPADLYCIDEAASFRPAVLEYLVEEAIAQAMEDFADSQILMSGTPGNTSLGYFHDADQRNNADSTWSSHHWTVLDNPYFERWRDQPDWQEQAKAFLRALRFEKGWSEDNAIFQREWMANWCTDAGSFYYDFSAARNLIAAEHIPKDNLKWVIGIDIGHRVDPTALTVVGYNDALGKNCYAADTRKLDAPTNLDQICGAIKELDDLYSPELIVGDYAGGGSFIFEEVAKRYDIVIQDAKKANKSATSEVINAELHEGRLKVASHLKELQGELQTIRWDVPRKKPDPSYPNDLADSLQYAVSEVYAYLFKPKPQPKSEAQLVKEEIEEFFAREDEKLNQSSLDAEVWGIRTP